MGSKTIILTLTAGQREHVKMLTGFGPAKLTIQLDTTANVPFGKMWTTKMASKAVQLTGDQKIQIKEVLGENYDYLILSKSSVDIWRKG
ncbi:MAG: hypothetical protein ACFFED_17265 [Candidatus Thorarchaeota archaeon]